MGSFSVLLASRGLNEVTARPGDGRDHGYPGRCRGDRMEKSVFFGHGTRFSVPGAIERRRKGESAGASRKSPRRITDAAERIAPRRFRP
jgi:hypothetical protein